jgi:hypothetical protein
MISGAESLFANDAFYQAFQTKDIDAMDRLWARRGRVACIHPGWSALTSRDEIMESWQAIFSNPEAPNISCRGAEAFAAERQSFVVCYEVFGKGLLVATNIFRPEDGGWKMVHHQAGPCSPPPQGLPEEPEPPSIQ